MASTAGPCRRSPPRVALSLVVLIGVVSVGGACRRPPGGQPAGEALRFSGAPVVLVSIDTLRADHLPAYGYSGVETPAIDALRGDSILFAAAYATVPLTLPSHVSILTGLLPATHGVRNNLGYTFDAAAHPNLPAILREAGYKTGAAVSTYVLRAQTGIAAGFDRYEDTIPVDASSGAGTMERSGDETVAEALSWIEGVAERPFFAFVHLYEPHAPYEPPEPFRGRYASAYDGEIAVADRAVGRLLDGLREAGLYERAIVVLLSDHGEGLGDHGEAEHGVFLYREAIQVPLLVKLPRSLRAGSTVERPVSLVDVAPTVTGLLGVPAPPGTDGRSLVEADEGDPAPRPVFSETMYPRISLGWSELRSVVKGRYHYVGAPRPELYDLVDDPGETTNLVDAEPRRAAAMAADLAPFVAELVEPAPVASEEAERLRALGYLEPAGHAAGGPLPDPKDRVAILAELERALALAATGDEERAIAILRAVVDSSPGCANAWLLLARTLRSAGRPEEAVAAFEAAVAASPTLSGATAADLAELLLSLGRVDEAVVHARRAANAGLGVGHLLLARAALAHRDGAEAEREARIASADNTQRLAATVVVAEALVAQGPERLAEALATLEATRAELERRRLGFLPRLELVRGDVLARMGRHAEAEEAFRAEIRRFPEQRLAYSDLAVICYVQHRVGEARATLERLVEADPGLESLRLALTTCEQVGDREAAARWRGRLAAAR